MIVPCSVCGAVIDLKLGDMCFHCGHTHDTYDLRRGRSFHGSIVDWRRYHHTYFSPYTTARRFGKLVAVRSKHWHRRPDTRKEKRRRVAKMKKYGHRTGRIP